MFGSRFKAPKFLELFLYCQCVLAVMITISTGANALSREYAVGYSRLSTADPMGGQMQYSLWYPTEVPAGIVRLGPLEFSGTRDAEPAAGKFGLVVLSHGSGGGDLAHWDTAVALAKGGFIAAAPLHPRNNVIHDIHDDQRIVLDGRPPQLSAVIDALLAQEVWSRRIDPEKIGAFGFSAGGYTILAALGAERDYTRTLEHCQRHPREDPYCRVINGSGHARRVRTYEDPAQSAFDGRLRAAVIADPFTAPFSDEALNTMPPAKLLFFRPEIEDVIKAEFHVSRVVEILRRRTDFPEPREIVVPKANHYSFIGPIPDVIAQKIPKIASDPEGFDRVEFHDDMNSTIVAFFERSLSN